MKILVLNGSPKGDKSNTLKLTKAFLKAFEQSDEIEYIDVKSQKIDHCLGCFNCWTTTPGECSIDDDMKQLIEKYINADMIIWSFPLYYFGMPSKIKAFLDRLLPINLPFMLVNGETTGHPPRYDLSYQKYVLISTCGFYAKKNNYEGLLKQFEIIYGDRLTTLLCTEGELFRVPQLEKRTNEYLSFVEKAGIDYKQSGTISDEVRVELDKLLFPNDVFSKMADLSWNINKDFKSDIKLTNPKVKLMPATLEEQTNSKTNNTNHINNTNHLNHLNPIKDDSLNNKSKIAFNFMKQMSLIYNPSKYQKDIILEMYFTDINERYQLKLLSNKCELLSDNFLDYTTRIECDFELWKKISSGEVSGPEALMQKKYRVLGDFQTMLKMESFFSSKSETSNKNSELENKKDKKTNMAILILPWVPLWALLPINPFIAGLVSCFLSSLVILTSLKYKLTVYDKVGSVLVSILGLLAILNLNNVILVSMSYLWNGLLWFSSLTSNIPITAHYSCYCGHGGPSAFSNPIFMKTNKIISIAWILGNLLTTIPAFFMIIFLRHKVAMFTGLFLASVPLILGIFTGWFSKWYPAKIAKG